MSAAANAAGYLYASGRLGLTRAQKEQRRAERAAALLKRERESNLNRGDSRNRRATWK
jgi:hypothetical protein